MHDDEIMPVWQQPVFVKNGPVDYKSNPYDGMDPFDQSWDTLRSFNGLEKNFVRRTTRKSVGQPVTEGYERQSGMSQAGTGAESKQLNPGKASYINGYGAFDVINPPYNLYLLSGFFDTSFSNHAAIASKVMASVGVGYSLNLTSEALQSLQNKDKKKQDAAAKKLDKVKVEVAAWLESLNDQDGFTDTMKKVVTDYEATGNGYLEIGRTSAGRIGYVGHIPSTTIRVRRLKDGYVQIIGQKVVYFRNFGATNPDPLGVDPQPNEIIHFAMYSPLNTYYGVPDIVSAATSVVGDQQAEQYNLEYFENKAVPRYIITLKGAKLSPESEDKLFRFLQTNLKGQNHRTLYVPLPPDSEGNRVEFKMEPVEDKVQDASFDTYRRSNRENILLAHQVPLSKLGLGDGGGVAAAITQDRTFRDNVVRPLQRYLEKVVSRFIREASHLVEIRFNEASVVDETAQANIHEKYLVNGVVKPNEVRQELGKPQIDGLDEEKAGRGEDAKTKAEHDAQSYDAKDRAVSENASDSSTASAGRNPKGSGAKQDGNVV